jgi:hypothetical protein
MVIRLFDADACTRICIPRRSTATCVIADHFWFVPNSPGAVDAFDNEINHVFSISERIFPMHQCVTYGAAMIYRVRTISINHILAQVLLRDKRNES